jgi:hypothetical protein
MASGQGDGTSNWSDPRASAEDRDRFANLVQYHYAHGRLSAEDFDDRLDRVLAALTLGELYKICSDLPFPPPEAEAPRRRFRRR